MSCLHVFDMDGTLLFGSACLEISRAVGVHKQNVAIQDAWTNGDLSDSGYWENCLPLWDGLSEQQIDKAFADTRWLDGVESVFRNIKARDEHSIAISQSPQFFVERLKAWGLGSAFGAEVTPGNATGAEHMISSEDKLKITRKRLLELGLGENSCIAYGDSNSDLALFENLQHTVAVNAEDRIRKLATAIYQGDDLWAAYTTGRKLLDTQGQ